MVKLCVLLPLVAPSTSPATVALVSRATVYVPGLVTIAVSVEPGTELGFQLAATLQFPPLVLVHVMVAAGPQKSIPWKRVIVPSSR